MPTTTIPLDFSLPADQAWDDLAQCISHWAAQAGVPLRDALLLLPLAQHLPLARRAFGRLGGWVPRIETTRTLLATLGPAPAPPAAALRFEPGEDRLRADRLLGAHGWARGWRQRDPAGYDQGVAALVDGAQRLARRLAAIAPPARDAWLARARSLLAADDGPGRTERLLAQVALEWAAASSPLPTDALYDLRPAAWIALQAGGRDALAEALLARAPVPSLLLQAEPVHDPLAAAPLSAQVTQAACDDFEDEAEATAAQLLALLQQGKVPLALIAEDRLLVRRVAALLARQAVPVLDETGWTLSTTRAAAGLMALLRAAAPQASTDELLDWLKALPAGGTVGRVPVEALERALRRSGCTRVSALPGMALTGPAELARARALPLLQALHADTRLPLAEWLQRLQATLEAAGQWRALQGDAAGRQLLQALHLGSIDEAWRSLAEAMPLRFSDFVKAVDQLLEQASFEPPPPGVPPQVVITPLRRALLRPFAAAVLPGADERRLGAPPPPDALLGDTLSLALGLPGVEERRRDEAAAFAHLLRLPQVVLLHRVQDGPEPLAPSLLLERLGALRARAGAPVATAADPRVEQRQPLQPVEPPQPSAATQLPAMLSASTVQALRDCPYRFYARAVLRLREADELDDEAEKRDYGTWLHAVLLRFHAERSGSTAAAEPPLVHLRRLAEDERVAQGIDADSFLPFEASFERFAAHYVRWLQQRETGDAVWLAGEIDREVPLPGVAGIALQGRIDRIDRRSGAHELIDYKTESVVRLKEKVREPLEDTQLAFYAALALLGDEPPPALRATYLALDDPQGIVEVTHENVEASAQVLLDGVAGELQRLRAGAALPALGTGRVCDYCEARGLCRRDHWRDEPPAGGEAAG